MYYKFIKILYLLLINPIWVISQESSQYLKLKEFVNTYQNIQKQGGWPTIKYGKVLKLGMIDKNVFTLKSRLIISGELVTQEKILTDTFTVDLEKAVRLFQFNHNLNDDGIAGGKTIKELNIPVSERIQQIEANLKRWRVFELLDSEVYIYINIANQKLYLMRKDSVVLQMNVIVGRVTRKTPELNSTMNEVEFNPLWIISPGIMRKDILPKLKQNPSFITSNDMKVYTGSKEINSKEIDWSNIDPYNCPYTLIQRQGPKNPMGKIKFSFPNRHYVYMHDTPDTALFHRQIRTFSSGCIRLANARALAFYILKQDKGWNPSEIDSIISTGKNIKIDLNKPIRIYVGYHTAWVDLEGNLRFARDIYRKVYL